MHRGMMISAWRLIPGWGVYLFVYDAINRYWDERAVLGNNETLDSWTVSGRVLLGGTISGCIAWVASYPPDYIKTQIQAHPVVKWNYIHCNPHGTEGGAAAPHPRCSCHDHPQIRSNGILSRT